MSSLKVPLTLIKYMSVGTCSLQETFKMRKAERYLYLFEKALLICKKDDSLLTMKACIKVR